MTSKKKAQKSVKKTRETLNRFGLAIPDGIQALIWLIGVAAFIVMTVRGTVPLLTSYMSEDENVAIQTRLVMNEQFPPPQFILNIPHHIRTPTGSALGRISDHLDKRTETSCVECQNLAQMSWDVWRHTNITMVDFTSIYSSLSDAFLVRLLESERNLDVLDDANHEWNAPIVDAAISFFMWRYKLDRAFATGTPFHGYGDAAGSDYSNRAAIDLMNHRVIKALCRRFELSFGCQGYVDADPFAANCEMMLMNNTFPLLIDYDSLWLPLPRNIALSCTFIAYLLPQNNVSMWTQAGDTVSLYVDPLFPYTSIREDLISYGWYKITSANMVHGKPPVIAAQYSATMQTKEGRPDDVKRCFDETSPNMCLWKCTSRLAVEHCNCVPFGLHKHLQSENAFVPRGDYCTKAHYLQCNASIFNARQQCFKHCATPCEYTYYNFVVRSDEIEEDSADRSFTIALSPITSGPIIQFSNITKNGVDEMLSQLGGVIGLYLGITGLSVLTFLINIFDFMRQYYRRRKDGQKRRTWAISLFRMAAMNRLIGQSTDSNDKDGQTGKDPSTGDHNPDEDDGTLEEQFKMLKNEVERMKAQMAASQTNNTNNAGDTIDASTKL